MASAPLWLKVVSAAPAPLLKKKVASAAPLLMKKVAPAPQMWEKKAASAAPPLLKEASVCHRLLELALMMRGLSELLLLKKKSVSPQVLLMIKLVFFLVLYS